jgi:hypothetical protein
MILSRPLCNRGVRSEPPTARSSSSRSAVDRVPSCVTVAVTVTVSVIDGRGASVTVGRVLEARLHERLRTAAEHI